MSKKIILVTPFENRLAKRGTRFVDIANMLHEKGWKVIYITSNFSHAYKRNFTREEIARETDSLPYPIKFIPIIGYSRNISVRRVVSNLLMSYKIRNAVKREAKDGDILLVPSRPVDLIYVLSRLENLKLALDIRDTWPDALPGKNIFFEIYCNFFLSRSLEAYQIFFHISPSFTVWLNRYTKDKISTFVPPGFDSKRFPKNKLSRKSYDKIRLVFIGALQYQLDILPLIKAIDNDTKYHLDIYGEDGKGQRFKECNDYIQSRSLTNISIKGVLEPDKVAGILATYHVGVIPMITNSITNKMFDYIACGLPTMVIGHNDMSDFVLSYDVGWVTSFHHAEIISCLKNLNEKEILKKAENLHLIREKFDRNVLYETIHEKLNSL